MAAQISRRSLILGASAAVVTFSIPAPAFAASPGSVAERTIAQALNSAALRQKFTPKETWDIATKLGVTLENAAPRATPWLKLIAKASPIGRVITIVGAVALAYDAINDIWNAAPNRTTTKGTYDGTIPELCPIGQVCKYTDANGSFSITQTRETSASQSNWTHYGTYPVLKSVSLGSTQKPFVYTVYWKITEPNLPNIMNPIPSGPSDKKQVIAPGNLQEYLGQFADEVPSAVGLSQSINDMLEQMETTSTGIRSGLRTIASDVSKAISGLGTALRDLFADSAYDRAPNVAIDPTTGVPNPDPATNPTPGTATGPGTGTNPGTSIGTETSTGSDQCLPGSADCPAVVDWGSPPVIEEIPTVTPMSWFPNLFTPPQLQGACSGWTIPITAGLPVTLDPCPLMADVIPVVRPVIGVSATIAAGKILLDI